MRAVVKESLRPMTWAFWLNGWSISVVYEGLPPKVAADCEPHPEYQRATIRIDPLKVASRSDLLHTLRHELLHVVLSDMQLYRSAMAEFLCDGSNELAATDKVFSHAWELAVKRIEDILGEPEATLRAGRKKMGQWDAGGRSARRRRR